MKREFELNVRLQVDSDVTTGLLMALQDAVEDVLRCEGVSIYSSAYRTASGYVVPRVPTAREEQWAKTGTRPTR